MENAKKKVGEWKYFEDCFGFKEDIESVRNFVFIDDENKNNIQMTCFANDRTFNIGNFRTMAVKDFPKHENKSGVCMKIVLGSGSNTIEYDKIDVGALQSKPENRGATFQVASNFNCLEFVNENGSAREGITKYVADVTQGPSASISAAAGTLYRNYFVPHTVNGKEFIGQLETQINLLDAIPLLHVKNGYIAWPSEDNWTNLQKSNFNFNDVSNLKVGVHKLVGVTSGIKKGGMIEMLPSDSKQVINQVFTAAMNMTTIMGRWRNCQLSEDVARFILRGAYRGTLLSAIDNSRTLSEKDYPGKNKCFLTMIGGGVFANKFEWIIDAILEQDDLIRVSGLEIILVSFTRASVDEMSLMRLQSYFQGIGAKCELIKCS
jgi:hypothetical protein